MFAWKPMRLAGDLILVLTGVFWGMSVYNDLDVRAIIHGSVSQVLRDCYPRTWQDASWCIAATTCHLTWSVVLIYFFGRDFIHCIRGKDPAGPN